MSVNTTRHTHQILILVRWDNICRQILWAVLRVQRALRAMVELSILIRIIFRGLFSKQYPKQQ